MNSKGTIPTPEIQTSLDLVVGLYVEKEKSVVFSAKEEVEVVDLSVEEELES